MKFQSTINEINKTKRIDKLLRLSIILIENNALEEYQSCFEKIESFKNNKNFQDVYIKEVCGFSTSLHRTKFLSYILNNHTINNNFELFFTIAYYGINNANIIKMVLGHFNINLKAKYAMLLLLFINRPKQKEAKRILKYLEMDFTNEAKNIYQFFNEVNDEQKEWIKKRSDKEYGFSDFISEYDYKHFIIKHYHSFKDYLSPIDKDFYSNRYKLYLSENIKQF